MKTITLIIFIVLLLSCSIHAQEIIKINKYEFNIGESSKKLLLKYPAFQVDEYIDEEYPDDIGQYYISNSTDKTSVLIKFYKERLFSIYISDELGSGFFNDFNPLNYSFNKIGEETVFINSQFPNVITEIFQKNDIKLKIRSGNYGYLSIEKSIK